jgi:tRNA pseudouridine38-40 synthase
MRTIRLLLQYEGTEYAGWQTQNNAVTIQDLVEHALAAILQEKTRVTGASRTDSGVHAIGQVAVFKTSKGILPERLLRSLNGILPPDIRVTEADEAEEGFNPRYAREKTYRYAIACGEYISPFQRKWAWHIRESLDFDAMQEAARSLVGEHDFTSFTASGGGEKDHVRRIMEIAYGPGGIISTWSDDTCIDSECHGTSGHHPTQICEKDIVHFDITASGFLYKMVRNIIGTLVEVGRGKIGPEAMPDIIDARNRSHAGPTAPAHGLCLLRVRY